MSFINVDSKQVESAFKVCQDYINVVNSTKREMSNYSSQISQEWKDDKSKQLQDILSGCIQALDKPLKKVSLISESLGKLLSAVKEYESVNFGGTDNFSFFGRNSNNSARVLKKTESQKRKDLKTGLNCIDQNIENYKESLMERGVPEGAVMDLVLGQRRIAEEAELVRNINGDFSQNVPPFNCDTAAEQCLNSNFINYPSYSTRPRNLTATQYGFSRQTINGQEMTVYNDPVGTNSLLIQQQGNSQYPMSGTCGLCQCANMLTLAGIQGQNENTIISSALHSSDGVLENLEVFNPYQEERGGTSTQDRQEILNRCGLSTYKLPVSSNRATTTTQLANAIQSGHGVIVSVDVAYLWRNGQSGGHAISLISVTDDGSTFIYNDTGRGVMGTISASDLSQALTGRPANITTNIIR